MDRPLAMQIVRSSEESDVHEMSQNTTVAPPAPTKMFVSASLLAATIIFMSSATATWAVTGSVVNGLAVGAYSALWGGPGFGVIAGGVGYFMSLDRQETIVRHEAAKRSLETGSKFAVGIDTEPLILASTRKTR